MNISIKEILKSRILVLDGAMGTMIQKYNLNEDDFRGEQFINASKLQKGNNDILSITQPHIISQIHQEYLLAGADIIETNTFNSNSISMQDYAMQSHVYEMNYKSAQLARNAADKFTAITPDKPRFVAGSIGPTNKTTSMSPRVEDPMYRDLTFDMARVSYEEQISALIDGGVDILLIETVFDTLNAKAALFAAQNVFNEKNNTLPIMISVTLSDKAGRTLSGQTLEGFLTSITHADLLSIGLNCSFGASEMMPHLKQLKRIAPTYISAYPNAGLPNQLGEYDETPSEMASLIKDFIDEGLVNIVGGCCGTTPKHIALFTELVKDANAPSIEEKDQYLHISGLEDFVFSPEHNFINIGERCNVAGSRRFLRLIKEKAYEEALSIAHQQVEDGAQILDINMDDGLLDGKEEMTNFLNFLSSDPDISRIPFMIDSSNWNVIEAGLKCVQGKSIVNSISLKNGEDIFLHQAKLINQYGAAVVIMAFDEKGQADSYERRIEICSRAYNLLVDSGFDKNNIIFDPNVLAIGTGIEEHKNYAVDFIKTIEWIKKNCEGAKVSGGISNLSFAFRGNNYIREVIHSVFLYHAINAGLDMGIVNPAQAVMYEEIDHNLKILVEDLILNRTEDATEKLMEFIAKLSNTYSSENSTEQAEWRTKPIDERLTYSLTKGINDYLEQDIEEALKKYPKAVDIIDQPLMRGMSIVGELFGSGKMFLPQVVKAARTMKRAVAILQPVIENEKSDSDKGTSAGKILLATVKGDVHDIGKNIVSIILQCNNYEVIDLGVMVAAEEIIDKIKTHHPDVVGLSGLITPSLEEMSIVATEMGKAGFSIPLLIGGATTSKLHTALKIAPKYSQGSVFYVKDASQSPIVMSKIMNDEFKSEFTNKIKEEYRELREEKVQKIEDLVDLKTARKNNFKIDWSSYEVFTPKFIGRKILNNIKIEEITPYIDWRFFFHGWNLSARFASIVNIDSTTTSINNWVSNYREEDQQKAKEAIKLYNDAQAMLHHLVDADAEYIKAVFSINKAYSEFDTIYFNQVPLAMLRQQKESRSNIYMCLSDFIAPKETNKDDYLGAFAVTAGADAEQLLNIYKRNGDEYNFLLLQSLLDRLAEGATEWLHERIRKHYWGYAEDEDLSISSLFASKYTGIRPAVGYPSIPDQSINFDLHNIILESKEIGISLTENGLMYPNASVSGFIFAHPQSRYFAIGPISREQVLDYATRRKYDFKYALKFLASNYNNM